DLDLAADDLLLEGVQVRRDVVDETTAGGVTDTVDREVVDRLAGREGASGDLAEVLEDRDVHVLEHRGHDDVLHRRVGGVVLVGVDTARLAAGLGGRLEDAATRATGRVVDDVRTVLVHALGRGLALGRVTEAGEVRRLGEVGDVDGDVRV